MKLFVKNTENLKLPFKANGYAACYDIYATTDPKIVAEEEDIINFGESNNGKSRPPLYRKIQYLEYGTGLFVTPGKKISIPGREVEYKVDLDWHLQIFPRSSNRKTQLVLANSIPKIDVDYQGEIKICFFYIFAPKDLIIYYNEETGEDEIVGRINPEMIFKKGDRLVQLEPVKNTKIDFEIVKNLPIIEDGRKEKGFGSTGL